MAEYAPLVSVIIPVYNCADRVAEAIESVLAQSYRQFEIIVVDDGSTDETPEVLARYGGSAQTGLRQHIQVYRQENQGVAAARNAGVRAANGELIAFLDADDTFFHEKLAKQVALFERSRHLGMVISGWQLITADGEEISQVRPWEHRPSLDLETAVLFKPARPSATLLRKDWVEQVGGFDTELSSAEDLDFLLRLMVAGCKAAWLPDVLVSYRQSASSLMKQGERLLQNTEQVMAHFFEQTNLPLEIRQLQRQERYQSWMWLAAKMYFEGQLALMTRCLQQSLQYGSIEPSMTIFEWFQVFQGYAAEYGYEFDAYALTGCREWQSMVKLALSPWQADIDRAQRLGQHGDTRRIKTTDSAQKGHVLLYSDDPGAGGILQCNHAIVCHLAEVGYVTSHVHCCQQTPLSEREAALGVQAIDLGYHADSDLTRSLKDLAGAKKLFLAQRPDLIVFSDGWPFSNVAAKQAAYELGIPYVIVLGFIEPSCVNYDYQDGVNYRDLVALQYMRSQSVVAVSQENLELLRELFKLPDTVGEVIYNGRPAPYFEPLNTEVRRRLRKEVGIPEEAVVCFTSGRLEAMKGYQYQVRAIQQLKELSVWDQLYFVWAGPGEGHLSRSNERELKQAVAALGVSERVKFLGQRWDVADWLDASDIFVLSSEAEGMPLSVMEAMAKGLPVVATAVSGVPEELGDTGMLLSDPTKDDEATVNELVSVIEAWTASKDSRRTLGRQCRQRAVALFQQAKMLQKYEVVISAAPTDSQVQALGHLALGRLTVEEVQKIEKPFRYGCWLWMGWHCYQQQNFEEMDVALGQAIALKASDVDWPLLEWGRWFVRFCKEQQVTFETDQLMCSKVWQRLTVDYGEYGSAGTMP